MSICYDISSIGAPKARWSGVARVVSEFLQQISHAEDRYSLSASGSVRAQYYIEQHLAELQLDTHFAGVPLGHFVKQALLASERAPNSIVGQLAQQFLRVYNRVRSPFSVQSVREMDGFFSFFAGIPPEVRRAGVPTGLFVHDIIPLLFPEFCRTQQIPIFQRILNSVRPEDLIVVNSECTKRDLCEHLNWSPDSIKVVHLAADPKLFYPVGDAKVIEHVRAKYGIRKARYFLSLHSFAPHKNMSMLVRAYACYRQGAGAGALPLVIAGGKDITPDQVGAALGVSALALEGVTFIGFVDDADMAAIYSGAQAFLFPSLYEGFGLPVVEALFCGTPVYAANRASLPEVVQSAEQLLDPQDEASWTHAFANSQNCGRLSAEELACVQTRFNWSKAAMQMQGHIQAHVAKS
jgi:glycosyltransferase involved in cell wall biosynthesis